MEQVVVTTRLYIDRYLIKCACSLIKKEYWKISKETNCTNWFSLYYHPVPIILFPPPTTPATAAAAAAAASRCPPIFEHKAPNTATVSMLTLSKRAFAV